MEAMGVEAVNAEDAEVVGADVAEVARVVLAMAAAVVVVVMALAGVEELKVVEEVVEADVAGRGAEAVDVLAWAVAKVRKRNPM